MNDDPNGLPVTTGRASRTDRAALCALLATALGLRVWNLTTGVPYDVGVDEPQLVDRALRMMKTGDYHPHFFDYPGLYIYAQLLVGVCRFVVGAVTGEFRSLAAFTAEHLYPAARLLTALLGAATVWVTLRVGVRWGRREALMGALLMALLPLHVRESHFVLTDVPVTFLVTLALLTSIRAAEHPTLARFAQAGAVAGLAAATKYNGGLVLILPLVALWPGADATLRARRAVVVMASAVAAFLVAAPYTALDLPAFLQEFARLNSEYNSLSPAAPPWLTYLKHLRLGFGSPALLASLCGLGLTLYYTVVGTGRVRRLWWLLLALFPLLYFVMLSGRTLVFGRYVLPMLPMLCLMAGIAVVAAAAYIQRRVQRPAAHALVLVLVLAVLVPPARTSVLFDVRLGAPSTRQRAFQWLRNHVAPDATIAIERGALRLAPGLFDTVHPARIIDRPLAAYRAQRVAYLITSSETSGAHSDLYREYFSHLSPVFIVAPTAARRGPEIQIYAVPAESP